MTKQSPTSVRSKEASIQQSFAVKQANDRGVFAARRLLAKEDYSVMQAVAEKLQPEVVLAGRLFTTTTLATTVIGFSRFNRRHQLEGPPTREIAGNVPSATKQLTVRLGNLAVFGPPPKPNRSTQSSIKLGITLFSEELEDEERVFGEEFRDVGFPLRPDPNVDPEVGFVPHLSIATIFGDYTYHFRDKRTLRRLGEISDLTRAGRQSVSLDPIPLALTETDK